MVPQGEQRQAVYPGAWQPPGAPAELPAWPGVVQVLSKLLRKPGCPAAPGPAQGKLQNTQRCMNATTGTTARHALSCRGITFVPHSNSMGCPRGSEAS